MKTTLLMILFTFSVPALAGKVECSTPEHKLIVQSDRPGDLRVTFRNETVAADGILNTEEVDLVARFRSIGEMTLFAKIGKNAPENYAFIQGRRFSVICR